MKARGLCAALSVLLAARATSGESYLQWSQSGNYFNFPSASPYAPVIATPQADGRSLLVVFTSYADANSSWTVAGLDVATGATNWTLSIAAPSANDQPTGLSSALPPAPQPTNFLSLALFYLGGQLCAVDTRTGRLAWQHTPYNASQPIVTGWSDATTNQVYLTSTFFDANRPVPVQINVVEALDAATGALAWRNNTLVPLASGLLQSDTAAGAGVTALPGLVAYAQGARVAAMAADTGKQAWAFAVGGSGTGATGANANITSVAFVEPATAVVAGATGSPPPGSVAASSALASGGAGGQASAQAVVARSPAGALLLTNTVFQTVRFLMYNLNTSLAQAPSLAWSMTATNDLEGALADGLIARGLQTPVVSARDGLFYVWSNRTVYNQSTGVPSYQSTLVARSLADGKQVWARQVTGLYLPYVSNGRVYVVTSAGLQVMDARGGQTLWSVDKAPAQPDSYSYRPAAAFDYLQGQLAVVRCLGDGAPPTSVCVYSGFAAAPRQQATSGAGARSGRWLAAAAGVAAALWLA